VSPYYDETLNTLSAATAVYRSLGKVEIGALVLWKRMPANTAWAARLQALPDGQVRQHTAAAVDAATNPNLSAQEAARAGRTALTPLPGFEVGDALASAVLVAAAPERMAIYDRRAHAALERLGLHLTNTPGRYGRYMALIDQLTRQVGEAGHHMTPRQIDTALYWLGGRATSDSAPAT
jgi:hypothetical protein